MSRKPQTLRGSTISYRTKQNQKVRRVVIPPEIVVPPPKTQVENVKSEVTIIDPDFEVLLIPGKPATTRCIVQ